MGYKSLQGAMILHIDDDGDFRTLTKTQLKSRVVSMICHSTINGHHALELLKKYRFDLVLCDYNLPDMTGLNLMINSRNYGVDTPYVFLSSQENQALINKTIQFGAIAFHNKLDVTQNFDTFVESLGKAMDQQRIVNKHLYPTDKDEYTLRPFSFQRS